MGAGDGALLPGGHHDPDLVSSEVVQALLRAGKVAEASARAEAVLARQHAARKPQQRARTHHCSSCWPPHSGPRSSASFPTGPAPP